MTPVGVDRCTCGGVLTPAPNGRATCQPTRMTIRCDHCDLPLLGETHTHHTPGCGINTTGCTCPPTHPWCCQTCKQETK